jgi:hypothetical protein
VLPGRAKAKKVVVIISGVCCARGVVLLGVTIGVLFPWRWRPVVTELALPPLLRPSPGLPGRPEDQRVINTVELL